jgi:predicted RNA-binding protein YlqC (UPF0109 family)
MTTAVLRPSFAEPEAHEPLEDWELLLEVVLALVTQPKQVRVEEQIEGATSHFLVYVAAEDLGKVIGRNGETVTSMRKLFGRIAAGRGRKTFIYIAEPGKMMRRPGANTQSIRRSAVA